MNVIHYQCNRLPEKLSPESPVVCVECDLKETDSLARSWRVHEVSPRGEGLPEMCTIEKNEKEFTKKCCF